MEERFVLLGKEKWVKRESQSDIGLMERRVAGGGLRGGSGINGGAAMCSVKANSDKNETDERRGHSFYKLSNPKMTSGFET